MTDLIEDAVRSAAACESMAEVRAGVDALDRELVARMTRCLACQMARSQRAPLMIRQARLGLTDVGRVEPCPHRDGGARLGSH